MAGHSSHYLDCLPPFYYHLTSQAATSTALTNISKIKGTPTHNITLTLTPCKSDWLDFKKSHFNPITETRPDLNTNNHTHPHLTYLSARPSLSDVSRIQSNISTILNPANPNRRSKTTKICPFSPNNSMVLSQRRRCLRIHLPHFPMWGECNFMSGSQCVETIKKDTHSAMHSKFLQRLINDNGYILELEQPRKPVKIPKTPYYHPYLFLYLKLFTHHPTPFVYIQRNRCTVNK